MEEKQNEIQSLHKEIDVLKNKIQEVEYTSKMSKQLTDNQNKELKKEIERDKKKSKKKEDSGKKALMSVIEFLK